MRGLRAGYWTLATLAVLLFATGAFLSWLYRPVDALTYADIESVQTSVRRGLLVQSFHRWMQPMVYLLLLANLASSTWVLSARPGRGIVLLTSQRRTIAGATLIWPAYIATAILWREVSPMIRTRATNLVLWNLADPHIAAGVVFALGSIVAALAVQGIRPPSEPACRE